MVGHSANGMPQAVPPSPLWRGRVLLIACLLFATALAWAWLLAGAGMDMDAFQMTAMAGMDGWLMQPAVWSPGYALLLIGMWWAMMAAMMLPSAMPVLLLFTRVTGGEPGQIARSGPGLWFALGYLLAWGGFSVAATAMQWALEATRLLSPMLETTHHGLGAAILVLAGAWQLTPVKRACLRHCQSPLGFIVGHWRDGASGALRMGLRHGIYCLGCCWFLMLLLFFGGVMNLYWIVGLTAYVLLEKAIAPGNWLGRATGILLIVWGIWLAVQAP